MNIKSCQTIVVEIHMAGDIALAKQILSQEFYPPNQGCCVTIHPQTFVYTAGVEEGFVIGLRNYPRFPSNDEALVDRAMSLAKTLIAKLCQKTAMVVAGNTTTWLHLDIL